MYALPFVRHIDTRAKRYLGLISFLALLWLTACGWVSDPAVTANTTRELNVFAAASLTEAFSEIGRNFEATHEGVQIVFNFAGSQQLAQQITQGAPADVFASANIQQMNAVIEAGEVEKGEERIFVRNRLVVIYPEDNPAQLVTLQDLAAPGLKLVLAAREVPVGSYSLDFLAKAREDPAFGPAYQEGVLNNVVSYEENVRVVLNKVVLGEADAGIVYTSDASGEAAAQLGRLDIPDALNTIAIYPIAVTRLAAQHDLAQQFVAYVLSAESQAILAQYGFIPTNE